MTKLTNRYQMFDTCLPKTSMVEQSGQWTTFDSAENYVTRGNKEVAAGSVSYNFNSLGYRCNEFSESNVGQTLFVGCSITMGEGVPVNKVWAYQVWEHIRQLDATQTRYINLSVPGASWDYIARTLMQVIPRVMPRRVIVYFPSVHRREIFNPNFTDVLLPFHWVPTLDDKHNAELTRTMVEMSAYREYVGYRTMTNLRIIENMCKSYMADLIWTSWDQALFADTPGGIRSEYGKYYYAEIDITKKSKARDGAHPGIDWHDEFAQKTITALEDRF